MNAFVTGPDLPSMHRRVREALRGLGYAKVKDGSWFRRVLERHAEKHQQQQCHAAHWDALYPGLDREERAQKHVKRACRRAAAAGAMASLCASTGEILSLVTEGLAAPVGLPAALASMIGEAIYTSLVQLDLATDLASMFGVPFGHDVEEMSTLFAVALEVDFSGDERKSDEDEAPRGLLERLMALEDGEVATRLGRKMLEDAVMKNVVPVVGLAISARWNHVATATFGRRATRYVRFRRALDAALGQLDLANVADPALFIEGAWLLATSDGGPSGDEVQAMARLVGRFDAAGVAVSERLDPSGGEDSEPWFEKLARIEDHLDLRLLDLLALIAAIDSEPSIAERRFLRRVGRTIRREIDFQRIELCARHLRHGDDLPDDFFAARV